MADPLNQFFAAKMAQKFPGADVDFLVDLMRASREGHICIERAPSSEPSGLIYDASASEELVFPLEPVVRSGGRYYLQRNWVYETIICQHIRRLRSSPLPKKILEDQKDLPPSQLQAIEHALTYPLTIISGGPGTGKTYTASRLIRILAEREKKKNYKVYLTAPTGKAAQHLQNVLGNASVSIRAETLHRLLKLSPGRSRLFETGFLDADLIIVDEASMMDIDLWAHLLSKISSHTKIVFLGDPDQLPPVEAGSIFADLSDLFSIRLEKCMRTDQKEIQDFCSKVQTGSFEEVKNSLESGIGATYPITPSFLYEKLAPPIFSEMPDPKACLEHWNRFKILGALRQGPNGIDELNQNLLHLYIKHFRQNYFWAAPILITSNDSRLGLYNGSSGVLIGKCGKRFDPKEALAYFLDPLSGEMKQFSPHILPHYEWAFCLSIHKSQGSEFDHVLALFPEGSEQFGKEALYTAASRAKKSLQISIQPHVLASLLTCHSRKTSGIIQRIKKIPR